jgi:carboxyl-terminal processing protease
LKDEEYEVENELKVLEKGLERSRKKLLVKYKEEIKTTLEKEIIRRFFYRKGAYDYFTLRDVEVNMARDLLNDTVKYFDIIK